MSGNINKPWKVKSIRLVHPISDYI